MASSHLSARKMDEDVKIAFEHLRSRLKAIRMEKGLSIRKAAAIAHLEPSLIDQFERHGRDIGTTKLLALAKALEVDLLKNI